MPPEPDFGVRSVGTRINRVVPGSNADRIGLKAGDVLVRLNDETVPVGVDVAEALEDIEPGSPITLLVARNNAPVELSGRYEPQIVTPAAAARCSPARAVRAVSISRGPATPSPPRRAASPAFTLLLSPDQFDFGKPVKVVANGRTVFDGKVEKNAADAAEVGRRRQRPHDALRRRDPHRSANASRSDSSDHRGIRARLVPTQRRQLI